MTTDPAQTGAYLSDDAETRMRLAMPHPCRACRHLIIRRSLILDDVLKSCEAAGENEVLGRVLLRLAESGRCDEADPFLPADEADDALNRLSTPVSPNVKEPTATEPPGAEDSSSDEAPAAVMPTPLSSAIDLFVAGVTAGARR